MKIVYISSSVIPSRTANSIHVMKMCQAFAKNGHEVILLAPNDRKHYEPGVNDVYAYYGVERCFEIIKLPWLNFKGKGYFYGALAAQNARRLKPDLVFGRNTIGCAFSAFMGLPVMFESHSPRIRSWLFNRLSHHPNLKKFIVITHSLKQHYLVSYPHLADKIDVAPDGADPISPKVEPVALPNAGKLLQVGYVGHLYKGRGVEMIAAMAKVCPWANFHLVGGRQTDIDYWAKQYSGYKNVVFHGFVPPAYAERLRLGFDVLLAPYQEDLATGSGENTVSWMSPLKVFEYMAAEKPIICSDLPVLKEILEDGRNALLCKPSDSSSWVGALECLRDNPSLGRRLAEEAFRDFLCWFSWEARAKGLLPSVEDKRSAES
jgi:glycosyltransferase involved in cell wall biosynthesis